MRNKRPASRVSIRVRQKNRINSAGGQCSFYVLILIVIKVISSTLVGQKYLDFRHM